MWNNNKAAVLALGWPRNCETKIFSNHQTALGDVALGGVLGANDSQAVPIIQTAHVVVFNCLKTSTF
jgi:hypothetical protein